MRLHYSNNALAIFLAGLIGMGPVIASAQELDEVIVTATKRERSAQDIGLSIDAFSADDIGDLGWTDVTQVANQSPNLDIKYAWGNSMPIYTIRGVGMNSFQASDTPSVGLFVDEVFQTSIAQMGTQLFDIERVEVLKGPQGALFGRNTNGGAVSYFTRKPSQESDGFVRVDVGRFNRKELEAAFGGALSETVSARLSAMTIQQSDGWVFDRTSGKDIGEADITALRAQLLFEPSDDLDILVSAFTSRDRSQPVYFQHIGFWDPAAPGTFCAAYEQTGMPDPATCVDVLGYSDTDGDPYAGDYTDRPDTPINSNATLRNDQFGANITINKDFDRFRLTSITSFQSYDRYQPKESDANPGLFVDFLFASDIEAFSQELRLTSSGDGMFSWIAGVSYSTDDIKEDPPRIGYLDDFIGLRARLVYSQERDSLAAFAQGEWELNDQWRLTVGARIIDEQLDFTKEVSFLLPPDFGLDDRLILAVVPDPTLDVDGKLDSTEPTWRVALDYNVNEDLLLYGSVSTGYKGGGFNGGLATNPRLSVPFDPEDVLAWEAGVKSTLADGRVQLNAAAFVYDYKGLQAATPRVDEVLGTPLNFLTNLEAADVTGFEAEFDWLPIENLEIQLGAGFLDTENNDPGVNFDGPFGNSPRELPNAPATNINAAIRYDVPLTSGARLRFFTDYVWQDDHYKEIVNNLLVESQSLWNARVTWFAPNDRWSVSLWGKNLADEVYVVDTLTDPFGSGWGVYVNGMPRTYGVSARFDWGQ